MSWLFKDPVVIMKKIMSWLFKDPIKWPRLKNQTVKSGLKAEKFKLPQMNFALEKELKRPLSFCKIFIKKILVITFIYLLALFTVQNLKEFLQQIQNYDDALLGPKWSNNFFWKIITIILIYLLAPFIVQNFKNSSSGSRVMRMYNLWAHNSPFHQIRVFFWESVNEPCFFYSCLSPCQKSKSDINLLVKYWWLKNTEISLGESHFCL